MTVEIASLFLALLAALCGSLLCCRLLMARAIKRKEFVALIFPQGSLLEASIVALLCPD